MNPEIKQVIVDSLGVNMQDLIENDPRSEKFKEYVFSLEDDIELPIDEQKKMLSELIDEATKVGFNDVEIMALLMARR